MEQSSVFSQDETPVIRDVGEHHLAYTAESTIHIAAFEPVSIRCLYSIQYTWNLDCTHLSTSPEDRSHNSECMLRNYGQLESPSSSRKRFTSRHLSRYKDVCF